MPLGSTAVVSSTDAAIYEKMFGSGNTPLIISNEEMKHIMEIVKLLKESGLLIKDVSETIKNEVKNKKEGFFGMLLDTLDASLLGNLLASKVAIRAGKGTIKAGERLIRAGQDI